ncbi:MAG: lamin tail domain-containing protein [Candidatus Nanohalobium sp.]
MVEAKQAIIFSIVFVVLLSIPVASQQVKIQESSKNGFKAVIDTDFSDKFSFRMDAGMEKMKLVDSEARFRMMERPSKKVKSIDTPRGSLKITRSNNSVVKKVETPYGTLKTGVKNGERFSSFTGLNRSKVEALKQRLEKRLGKKMREASAKKQVVLDRVLPDVELSVAEGGSSEHINITNVDNRTLGASWTLSNEAGDSYSVNRVLAPGETLTLYSKDYSSSRENTVSGTGITLYDGGGEIELRNREGYLLASEAYN